MICLILNYWYDITIFLILLKDGVKLIYTYNALSLISIYKWFWCTVMFTTKYSQCKVEQNTLACRENWPLGICLGLWSYHIIYDLLQAK